MKNDVGKKGFTLIEVLIVIAISAVLATIAIGFNNSARNEVALSVETAKLSQFVITAKGLALASYTTGVNSGICGYGVYINIPNNTYSIFAYKPSAATYGLVPPCPPSASTTANGVAANEIAEYLPSSWQVKPASGVVLKSGGQGNDLSLVLFYPPAPLTLISTSTADPHHFGSGTANVFLVTTDGKASSTISVSPGGQVNF